MFMIADSALASESWIQDRISEFMMENVSKGVDPVLVVWPWTVHHNYTKIINIYTVDYQTVFMLIMETQVSKLTRT